MPVTMKADGYDLSNIGFDVHDASTRRAFPTREWSAESVPGRAGRVLTDDEPQYAERELVVTGRLTGTSDANFQSRRDELAARLDAAGIVEILFSDQTDRRYRARLKTIEHSQTSRSDTARDDVEITFDLLDPWAYETSISTVSFGSTRTQVPLGTAPTRDFTVRIHGSFTDPSLKVRRGGLFHYQPGAGITGSPTFSRSSTAQYQDSGGTMREAKSGVVRDQHYVDGVSDDHSNAQDVSGSVVYQTDFTLSKSDGEYLEMDFGAGTITDDAGNSQISAMDTGSDFPFPLDPRDARYEQSLWVWIEVTSGGGELKYRKAYS